MTKGENVTGFEFRFSCLCQRGVYVELLEHVKKPWVNIHGRERFRAPGIPQGVLVTPTLSVGVLVRCEECLSVLKWVPRHEAGEVAGGFSTPGTGC